MAWPVALEALVETVRWFLVFVIIERLGEQALSQSNIIYMCFVVFLLPIEGFSEATCSMVSNLIGQDKSGMISVLLRRAMSAGYIITLPLLAIALIWPEGLLSVFTDDAATRAGCVDSLRIIALAILIAVPGEMCVSAVRGTGDTVAAFATEFVRTACIIAYTYAATFSFALDLAYIWLSVVIGWVVVLSLAWFWFGSGKWKRLYI